MHLYVRRGATQEKLKQFGSQTLMGRVGQPVELASISVQLAASDASSTIGQIYNAIGLGRFALTSKQLSLIDAEMDRPFEWRAIASARR